MTLALSLPTMIPSFVVVGKGETVVIEFKSKFASSQGLITLDFLDDATKKLDTAPCTQLGPNTVKAYFPAFSKPGMIEVVPKIGRQSNPLFPTFKVYVASPVEAIYSRCTREEDKNKTAILSCILTYITHLSSEDAQATRLQADTIICKLLCSMPEIPQWDLSTFLCGGHDEDNLLHFAVRYRLDGMAENLAQRIIQKNKQVLWQVSSDKKTPLEIAKQHRLVNAVAKLEQLQARYEPQGKKAREKKFLKKKGNQHAEDEKKKQLPESDCRSSSGDVSCQTSIISSSSVPESICSSVGTENKVTILKALKDFSCQYLYKAKAIRDYQCSSYHHGELSLKVGDIVYVMQEEGEECMGIADLKYGQFPRHVLQRINYNDPEGTDAIEECGYYKAPRHQPVYVDESSSDNESSPIYDIPKSASLPRKAIDTLPRSCSCDTGLDHIETVSVSAQPAAVEMPPLQMLPKTSTEDSSAVYLWYQDAVQNHHQTVLQMQNSPTAIAAQDAVFQSIPSASEATSSSTVCISHEIPVSPLQEESSHTNFHGAAVHPLSNQNTNVAALNLSASCHDTRLLSPDGEHHTSDHEYGNLKQIVSLTIPTPEKEPLIVAETLTIRPSADLGSSHELNRICVPSSTNELRDGNESTDGVKRSPLPKPRRRDPNRITSPTTLRNSSEIGQMLPYTYEDSRLMTPEPLNCASSAINSCNAIPSATVTTSTVAHKSPETILNYSNTTCSPLQPFTKPPPPAVSPRVKRQLTEGSPFANPLVQRSAMEGTPPVSPRLKRLQSH